MELQIEHIQSLLGRVKLLVDKYEEIERFY